MPSLIFIDFRFPYEDLDGVDFIGILRKLTAFPTVIVATQFETSYPSSPHCRRFQKEDAISIGADAWFDKTLTTNPYASRQLANTISDGIRRRERRIADTADYCRNVISTQFSIENPSQESKILESREVDNQISHLEQAPDNVLMEVFGTIAQQKTKGMILNDYSALLASDSEKIKQEKLLPTDLIELFRVDTYDKVKFIKNMSEKFEFSTALELSTYSSIVNSFDEVMNNFDGNDRVVDISEVREINEKIDSLLINSGSSEDGKFATMSFINILIEIFEQRNWNAGKNAGNILIQWAKANELYTSAAIFKLFVGRFCIGARKLAEAQFVVKSALNDAEVLELPNVKYEAEFLLRTLSDIEAYNKSEGV